MFKRGTREKITYFVRCHTVSPKIIESKNYVSLNVECAKQLYKVSHPYSVSASI